MITQRRLIKTEPVHTILFYYFLICVILSFPFTFETWKAIDTQTFLLLILIGLLFSLGQFFFLSSLKYEKPSFLSSFNYISVIYGVLIDWFLWDRLPSWTTIVGILIVCTGGIITIKRGNTITSDPKDRSSR